jgi:uncharacterized protein YecE (DUF72 family)
MIKIGTSGFSFKDWIGEVYPRNLGQKDFLSFYQSDLGFDCVEINSTYYTLVRAESFEGMEKKTKDGFEFVVKAYRGITHDPFDCRIAGAPDPFGQAAKDNIDKFVYSITPLAEKNKLSAVLLQFPVFFYFNQANKDYILFCRERFNKIPLVVEFRNSDWAKAESLELLEKNGLAYCAVDEPKLPRLMPLMPEVTGEIGYLRLHGRNKNWFNAPASDRYDYLYSKAELESFVPVIQKMDKKAKKTFVFFNNCHGGKAIKNAMMLKELSAL